MDAFVERYLELGLRLGRHAEDLVDSYYGPAEIAQRVDEEELVPADALAADAAALLAETNDPWFASQLRALVTTAERLAGTKLPYVEETERTYGIRPEWHDESAFEPALAALDAALPGGGDVRHRYARWLVGEAIPPERLGDAVRETAALLRTRAVDLVGLPDGEEIEVRVVKDKPWRAFARYLGDFRTEISINTDLPFEAGILAGLVAHEVYPGHHTHRVWQEAEVVRARGDVERTLELLWSPEAVIAEGIAELAGELVVDADVEHAVAELLARLGLSYDAPTAVRVQAARRALRPVMTNVSLLVHDRGASHDEAVEYVRRWSQLPDERVERFVTLTEEDESAGYVHTYVDGLVLVRNFVRGDGARLRSLMTGRLVPNQLTGGRT